MSVKMYIGTYSIGIEPGNTMVLREVNTMIDYAPYVSDWSYFFDDGGNARYRFVRLMFDSKENFFFVPVTEANNTMMIPVKSVFGDNISKLEFENEHVSLVESIDLKDEESEETSNFGLLAAAVDHICNYAYELGFDRGAVVKLIECHTSFVRMNNGGQKNEQNNEWTRKTGAFYVCKKSRDFNRVGNCRDITQRV